MKTSPFLDEIRTEGRAESILEVLEVRFQKLPSEIVDRLHQIRDVKCLSGWLKAAASANTLEEFLAVVAKD